MKNASWLIICRVFQSVLSMIVSMLTARYLGPGNYGIISYAASIVSFILPIMQLGLSNVLVQEIVESPKREGEILGTSIFMSACSAAACIIGIIAFVNIANAGEPETITVCSLYSLILFFQALEMIQYWFQAKLISKYMSVVSLCAYVIISAYKVFLLACGKGIYWFAISNALDILLIDLALYPIYRRLGGKKLKISWPVARALFAKSKYYIVSSMMVTIFAQTDKIMLKFMINEEATGFYSVATTCAGMTSFVFSAIIDSARPVIFESSKKNKCVFERNTSILYSVVIYLSLLQSVFMTLLARPIVDLLYGDAYAPAVDALKIVVWYTTFSYMGSVRNIWILAESKQKYLWIINLSGAATNVILNLLLIPFWGINGAAVASLITQIFTNIGVGFILRPIRRNNTLMLKGLNFGMAMRHIKSRSKE